MHRLLETPENLARAVSEAYQLMEDAQAIQTALSPEALGVVSPRTKEYIAGVLSYGLGQLSGPEQKQLAQDLDDVKTLSPTALDAFNALIGVLPELNPYRNKPKEK